MSWTARYVSMGYRAPADGAERAVILPPARGSRIPADAQRRNERSSTASGTAAKRRTLLLARTAASNRSTSSRTGGGRAVRTGRRHLLELPCSTFPGGSPPRPSSLVYHVPRWNRSPTGSSFILSPCGGYAWWYINVTCSGAGPQCVLMDTERAVPRDHPPVGAGQMAGTVVFQGSRCFRVYSRTRPTASRLAAETLSGVSSWVCQ